MHVFGCPFLCLPDKERGERKRTARQSPSAGRNTPRGARSQPDLECIENGLSTVLESDVVKEQELRKTTPSALEGCAATDISHLTTHSPP
ncbi:MAG: hypothetical protein Greene101449_1298 [Candidatus Peregrinibacteria bacterium Greene1014_49]|nr:MAG: hypothetical protein Greene101449_1298 [Candidatus Peregrinibacteria bacterium Greene1014_49]